MQWFDRHGHTVAAILGFPLLLVSMLWGAAQAQTSEDPATVESGTVIAWEHSGLDVDGAPEELASFRIDVYKSGAVGLHKSVDVAADTCTAGTDGALACEANVTDLLEGESEGTYELYVTAVDVAGNESDRSSEIAVSWDGTRPSAALNYRLEIRAVIEGGG